MTVQARAPFGNGLVMGMRCELLQSEDARRCDPDMHDETSGFTIIGERQKRHEFPSLSP